MYPPKPTTRLYAYQFHGGRLTTQTTLTTLKPELRLYSYRYFSDGASAGSTYMSDTDALQYNLTTDGGCFAVPFVPPEHIRAAAAEPLRHYTFRRFIDGAIAGEAWMTDDDALQFNLNSSKAVYVVPWVPPEQLTQRSQPGAAPEPLLLSSTPIAIEAAANI